MTKVCCLILVVLWALCVAGCSPPKESQSAAHNPAPAPAPVAPTAQPAPLPRAPRTRSAPAPPAPTIPQAAPAARAPAIPQATPAIGTSGSDAARAKQMADYFAYLDQKLAYDRNFGGQYAQRDLQQIAQEHFAYSRELAQRGDVYGAQREQTAGAEAWKGAGGSFDANGGPR